MKDGCVSMEAQWLNKIIKKNFDKPKDEKIVQESQDLMRLFPPCNYLLDESPQNSSRSKPSVLSNLANDPSNKSKDSLQLLDELKNPAEGFLKEAAGLHEAMSHLRPNVNKSNEMTRMGVELLTVF